MIPAWRETVAPSTTTLGARDSSELGKVAGTGLAEIWYMTCFDESPMQGLNVGTSEASQTCRLPGESGTQRTAPTVTWHTQHTRPLCQPQSQDLRLLPFTAYRCGLLPCSYRSTSQLRDLNSCRDSLRDMASLIGDLSKQNIVLRSMYCQKLLFPFGRKDICNHLNETVFGFWICWHCYSF